VTGRHAAVRQKGLRKRAVRTEAPRTEAARPAPSSTAGGDRSQSNGRMLRRGGYTSFALQSSGIALQYATQIVFARVLGRARFGTYTYALNYARIAGSIGHLGGASSALRLLPQYRVQQQWSLAAGVVRRFRLIAIVVGSFFALTAGALVYLIFGRTTTSIAICIALTFVPLASLVEVQQAVTRASQRIFKAFFPWLVLQPILLMAAVGVYYLAGYKVTLYESLWLTGGSFAATVVVQAWWLRQSLAVEIKNAQPAYDTREWAKVTLPILASNTVYLVFSRLDVVMVGVLRSPTEAGIYAVAMRAGTVVNILETAMASTLAPRISSLYWSDRRDEVEGVTLKAIYLLFIPSFLLTVVLSVFAHPILSLFGKGFPAGSTVLILIAIGQLVSVSSGAVGWLMNMTGQQNATAIVDFVIAGITMIGYLTLIPWLGITGAAIANGAAVVMRNISLNILVRRRLGYRISVLRAFQAH
jgi:O-antigen/teichoic acid export membrane protein